MQLYKRDLCLGFRMLALVIPSEGKGSLDLPGCVGAILRSEPDWHRLPVSG